MIRLRREEAPRHAVARIRIEARGRVRRKSRDDRRRRSATVAPNLRAPRVGASHKRIRIVRIERLRQAWTGYALTAVPDRTFKNAVRAIDASLHFSRLIHVANHLANRDRIARAVRHERKVAPFHRGEETATCNARFRIFERLVHVVVPSGVAEARADADTRVTFVRARLTRVGIGRTKERRNRILVREPARRTLPRLPRRFANIIVTRPLFHKWKKSNRRARVPREAGITPLRPRHIEEREARRGDATVCVVVVMHGDHVLFHVVRALHTSRSLARRLNRWKKKTDQDTDNGDHDQEFDECKTFTCHGHRNSQLGQIIMKTHNGERSFFH